MSIVRTLSPAALVLAVIIVLATSSSAVASPRPSDSTGLMIAPGAHGWWPSGHPCRCASWLALRTSGSGAELVHAHAHVRREWPCRSRKSCRPWRCPRWGWVHVCSEDGLVLLHGVKGLSAGSVATVHAKRRFLEPGESVWFDHGGRRWAITAFGHRDFRLPIRVGDPVWTNYSLVLTSGAHRQELFRGHHVRSGAQLPAIVWAGDADRDGRLDVLLDESTGSHEGAAHRMYLSSHGGHEMLAEVARFDGGAACCR